MTLEKFTKYLESRAESVGSWKALAQELGFSPSYVFSVKKGHTTPSTDFLKALGMVEVVDYKFIKDVKR